MLIFNKPMLMRSILVILFFSFFFISCKKESKTQATKLLWRVETHMLGGWTHVTYFNYDVQYRLTILTTYRMDSTGPTLDSALWHQVTYQYPGVSSTPSYYESRFRLGPNSYALQGTNISCNGSQVIYDSVFGIPGISAQRAGNYSFNGNEIYRARTQYTWAIGIWRDTFLVQNNNIAKYKSRHYGITGNSPEPYFRVSEYEYDNKVNPVKVPWNAQLQTPDGYDFSYVTYNNVIRSSYSRGMDSFLTTSQFQYDIDDYPTVEARNQKEFFGPAIASESNFIINYKYY
jgi:hypothetical protein